MDIKLKFVFASYFFFNLTNACSAAKEYLTKLPDVILKHITSYITSQSVDRLLIDEFKILKRITILNQDLVSTENVKDACEILNTLLILRNCCSHELKKHSEEILSKLLASNIINYADKCGNTVLHFACQKGYYRVVKFLIDKGANLNVYAKEKISIITDKRVRECSFEKVMSERTKKIFYCPFDQSILVKKMKVCDCHPALDAYLNGHRNCLNLLLKQNINIQTFTFSIVNECDHCTYVEYEGRLDFTTYEAGNEAKDVLIDDPFVRSRLFSDDCNDPDLIPYLICQYAADFDGSPTVIID